MSDMLEQAIIDADALRGAAIKNAESLVLEKYSKQIKGAVESLLEQDMPDPLLAAGDMGMPGMEPDPMAMPGSDPMGLDPTGMEGEVEESTVMEHIPKAATQKAGDIDKEIEIPLDALLEQIEKINMETEGKEEIDLSEGLLEDLMAEEYYEEDMVYEEDYYNEDLDEDLIYEDDYFEEDLDEELYLEDNLSEEELEEDLFNQIYEQLTVDIHPQKSGWAGTPGPLLELAEEELLALEQDSKVREEKDAIRKAVAELEKVNESLENKNEQLTESLTKTKSYISRLRDAVVILKEKLDLASLTNAKLLYTNKALNSDSLNERQKHKLAEAISNADNIEEAKVIFETLQSTVGSTSRRNAKQPKSLSEAVEKSSSMILSARKQSSRSQKTDPTLDRWRFLAGIKKDN